MPAEMSDYLKDKVLDHVLSEGVRPFTSPAELFMGLVQTTEVTSSMTGTTITEISWTGYARLPVTFNAASGGVCTDDGTDLDFLNATGAAQTAISAVICDAVTGGNLLYFDNDLLDTLVNIGATLRLNGGGIVVKQDTP